MISQDANTTSKGNMERQCIACLREHGFELAPNVSHGFCRRHTLAGYADLADYLRRQQMDACDIAATIEHVRQQPESDFCPDLGVVHHQKEAA